LLLEVVAVLEAFVAVLEAVLAVLEAVLAVLEVVVTHQMVLVAVLVVVVVYYQHLYHGVVSVNMHCYLDYFVQMIALHDVVLM
jgi:hypothetical protein